MKFQPAGKFSSSLVKFRNILRFKIFISVLKNNYIVTKNENRYKSALPGNVQNKTKNYIYIYCSIFQNKLFKKKNKIKCTIYF